MKMSQALAAPVDGFAWPPESTISAAAELHARLLTLLAEDPAQQGDVVVELGPVSDFDSSAVQLLLALKCSVVERGRQLIITSASASVRDALACFGLSALLADSSSTA